ncbi:uncharacterized protein LOC129802685 isoform X1 [Phlebotomus papatasi]|uniref:uncharacterized protein LOC129802685 isoform X1 n=1 Tax=Phlebotomus papatasi TaxID=29031 RepID=UPI0024833AC0|nr:uncharacterized protein LOC129802685 isoform X1 [Phlebotomus papatasi]
MPTQYKRKANLSRHPWTKHNLDEAISKVKNKTLSLGEASRFYKIPKTTLFRNMKVMKKSDGFGPGACLGKENEILLVEHIINMDEAGFSLNRKKVRRLAYEFAENLGLAHRFNKEEQIAGYSWFQSFMRRNPSLSIRHSAGLSISRAQNLTRESVNGFYDLLFNEIEKFNLQDKPENIWNCDESGLQLINSTGEVVAKKGKKNVNQITTGERGETVTILACCSAEGRFLPPTMILKGKNMKAEFSDGLPPGSRVFMNPKSGYVTGQIFLRWFEEVFLPRKVKGRNILILDGHVSHCGSLKLLDRAAAENVTLLCLPPHTIHVLQPLDTSFFQPFKYQFRVTADAWIFSHPGRNITRYQLGPLVREAWLKTATAKNAVNGFRTTGIYPLHRQTLRDDHFAIVDKIKKEPSAGKVIPADGAAKVIGAQQLAPVKTQKVVPEEVKIKMEEIENKTSEKLLQEIAPIPEINIAVKKSNRTRGKALVLTSTENRENLRMKNEKQKETERKSQERKKSITQIPKTSKKSVSNSLKKLRNAIK